MTAAMHIKNLISSFGSSYFIVFKCVHMLAVVGVFVNVYFWFRLSNIIIPIKNENKDVINVMISLFTWVLFYFDSVPLEFVDDLNELFELHVEIFLNVVIPIGMQIAQGVIDYKI